MNTAWLKRYSAIWFTLIALVGLVWELLPHATATKTAEQRLIPDWFGKSVTVVEMNEKGLPKRQFTAEKIRHYSHDQMTDLFKPSFTLFAENAAPWHLQGDKGRTFHGQRTTEITRLDLWHEVRLWQEDATRPTQVQTSTIAIFPEDSFAQTDQSVALEQPGHVLTGVGLKAHFDTQAVELLSDVRSEHAQAFGG